MKLGSIAKIRAGHNFRGPVVEHIGALSRVIQMRDVNIDADLDWNSLATCIPPRKKRELEWLKSGDIVLLTRGNCYCATYLGEMPFEQVVTTSHFFILSVFDGRFNPEFVSWQLNQHTAQDYFKQNAKGSGHKYILREAIEQIEITLSSEADQRQVIELEAQSRDERNEARLAFIQRREKHELMAKKLLS